MKLTTSSSDEVKNEWSSIYTPPHAFMADTKIKLYLQFTINEAPRSVLTFFMLLPLVSKIFPSPCSLRETALIWPPLSSSSYGPCYGSGFSCRPLTAKVRLRTQASPYEICGGQSGTGTSFPPSTFGFPCQYHSSNSRYSSSSKSCSYQKDKRAKPGNLP